MLKKQGCVWNKLFCAKKNPSSCRDTTEDDKHLTIISGWPVIKKKKKQKTLPYKNILKGVIGIF